MTVYKRSGAKSWSVLVEIPAGENGERRREYRGGFRTKREAEAYETEVRAQLLSGTHVSRTSTTVGSYLTEWMQQQVHLKPTTRQGYEGLLKHHVIPAVGHRRLQELSPVDLNTLYTRMLTSGRVKRDSGLGGPLSPRTVRQAATVVRRALQDALEAGVVQRNVALGARPPKVSSNDRTEMATWTAPEVASFLALTAGHRLSALWVVAVTTGLRRGEVLGLRWSDIDFDSCRASISSNRVLVGGVPVEGTPKSGKGRVIALASQTIDALRAWRADYVAERLAQGSSRDHDLVFVDELGRGLNPNAVTDEFQRIVKDGGLRRIRFHDLRHTWATLALGAGVPLKVVSENLGHSSIRVTADTYSHVTPPMASDAVTKVAEAIFGAM